MVASAEEMLAIVERGSQHRSMRETLLNEISSRSHAVFTVSGYCWLAGLAVCVE